MPEIEQDHPSVKAQISEGNGSVAHQIIGEFLTELAKQADFEDVAGRLSKTVYAAKVNETALKAALFGDGPL